MLIIDASSGIPLGISPVGLAVLQPASNRFIIFLEGGEGGGTVCEERPRKIALWTLYEQKKYGDLGIKHVCFIVRTRWGSAKHPNYGPIEKRSAEQKVPSKELRGFSVEVIVLAIDGHTRYRLSRDRSIGYWSGGPIEANGGWGRPVWTPKKNSQRIVPHQCTARFHNGEATGRHSDLSVFLPSEASAGHMESRLKTF